MKKFTLVSVAFICMVTYAQAQIGKGSVLLGGNIGFSTRVTKSPGVADYKISSVNISPSYAKAIKENYLLGFDISYGRSTQSQSLTLFESDYYGAGIFLRKYFPIAGSFYLFAQPRLGFGYSNSNQQVNTNDKQESKTYGAGISIYPGISFAVNKKLHLEAGFNNLISLNYQYAKTTNFSSPAPVTSTANELNFGTSLYNPGNFSVGFRLLLSK